MLSAERHESILRVLRNGQFASVAEITELLQCSEATIRRDLARLESEGRLRRVRGGAERIELPQDFQPQSMQLPFEYRKGILLEKKRLIGRKAASLCTEGETVIIDGGSTTFQMVEFLLETRLKIITNSFAIAEVLVKRSRNTVILNGGIVYPDSQMILDPFHDETFKNYPATKVFMGAYGIDEMGATNADTLLVIRTERAMIEQGKELIILVDSSKFNRRGNLFLCGFDKISTIITDNGISAEQREMVRSHGVELIVV